MPSAPAAAPANAAAAAADAVPPALQYHTDLRAPLRTATSSDPIAPAHREEVRKVREGLPVEINPSVGSGYKVMDWDEVRELAGCEGV